MTKVERFLRLLQSRPQNGMSYGDCQRFFAELNGYDFDAKREERVFERDRVVTRQRRVLRGYYCTNLSGFGSQTGLLQRWCVKGPDNKYRIRPGAVIQRPFYESVKK